VCFNPNCYDYLLNTSPICDPGKIWDNLGLGWAVCSGYGQLVELLLIISRISWLGL
jgi:hypothetical protein